MKNSISIFFVLLNTLNAHFGYSQIQFFGEPISVSILNSSDGENYLVLDPNSNRVAFALERSIRNPSGQLDRGDIWISELDTPIHLSYWNNREFTSPIGFLPNNQMLLNQVTFVKGIHIGQVLLANGNKTEPVEILFFKNRSPVQSGCLSQDGRYLILSLEANNTYGVEDLYVVKKNTDGSWDSPSNLGFKVNTSFQEITPFLAADNKTLFFATNGREGKGSFDIYSTVRMDDSWRNWSVPQNLSTINTVGAETSFSFRDGEEWAYFVSTQNSDGYGDIKRIRIKENIEKDASVIEEQEIVASPAREAHQIKLKVIDAKTRTSIPAELIQSDNTLISTDGTFVFDSLTYDEVEIKSGGYLPKLVILDDRLSRGEHIILLEPAVAGNTITLKNVLFHQGTSNMIKGSARELDLVVELMNDNPGIKILLKGHTDNQGDSVLNVRLSEARVKTVRAYLISKGINADQIREMGYGGNSPVASNASEGTRKLNRRVEFEVIE